MSKEELILTIINSINDVTGIDVTEMSADSAVIDDLEMNSLEILTMIAKLEKTYEVKFATKDLRSIVTIDDIADYIFSKF